MRPPLESVLNHVQVVYAPDAETADRALLAKAAFFTELGLSVHFCGTTTSRAANPEHVDRKAM